MLELIEELHQEERELQLIRHVVVQFLQACILDANLDEILSGDFRPIVHDAIHFILDGEHVVKVHLGQFVALFVRDLHAPHVLVRRQFVDSHGKFPFSERAHVKIVQKFLQGIGLS